MAKTLIVVDLGTSSVKSYLYDLQSGEVLGHSRIDILMQVPEMGAAEVDPTHWWQGLCDTVGKLLKDYPQHQAQAITLANQQISCVFLDDSDQPVFPALLWMDTRCTEDIANLKARCEREGMGLDWISAITGIPPSDSWGLAKLMWFKRKFPDRYQSIRRVASVDAYIIQRLSGRFVTDETNACFFHMDIRTRKSAKQLLQYLELNRIEFPEIVPPGTQVGMIHNAAALQTGLLEGLPVIAAASDQPCAMLGMGVSRPGEAVVNLGTGTFFMTPLDSPLTDRRMMTNISAVSGQWLMMGTHYLTGGALNWLRNIFVSQGSTIRFSDMDEYAQQVKPGSDGLVFLPGLSGNGTPRWDPDARGLFAGLELGHSVGHLARAVMESTGYGIRSILDAYTSIGVNIKRLIIAGGPTVSTVWNRSITDILQCQLELSHVQEATPLGAAMLAAVVSGRFANLEEAIREWSQPGMNIVPDPSNQAIYEQAYHKYLCWQEAEASVRFQTKNFT